MDDLPARTPDSKPREAAEARASRVAAEARASIKRGRKENDALGAASSMDVWPTKWGVFHVGPKMKSLKEWLDDDPRNPAFADERRLKSISALLMKTAAKVPPLPDASGEVKEEPKTAASADRLQGDVEMAAEPKPNAETKPAFDANGNDTKPFSDAFDVFGLRRDGYAALDAAGDAAMARAPDARARAQARDDAATALCAVIRFVLSGSTKFWAQSTQWLRACLNLCAALPGRARHGRGRAGARRRRRRPPGGCGVPRAPPPGGDASRVGRYGAGVARAPRGLVHRPARVG
jgi:hypothetical protein